MRPALLLFVATCAAAADGPSFDCAKVRPGSVEETICKDAALAALDRQLADVYAAAEKKKPVPEQDAWLKERDDCGTSTDCLRDAYRRRIAEIQARNALVPSKGPFKWQCDDNAATEYTVTFFETDPATLIADRGDETSLMYQQPSGSGTRYAGRDTTYWEHHGEATIAWGKGAEGFTCKPTP